MQYKLVFSEFGDEPEKVVEFEADDAAAALIFAHEEAFNRSAQLWSEDRQLCNIRRMPCANKDLWEISSAIA